MEPEFATARSCQHRVELRGDSGHALLNLRAEVTCRPQVIRADALKKLPGLCGQRLEFLVVSDVAEFEVREKLNEVRYCRFLESQ